MYLYKLDLAGCIVVQCDYSFFKEMHAFKYNSGLITI